MSDKNAYQELIEHFREWIFGLPDSEYLIPMLKLRFSPEEAEICAKIPYLPHTIKQLSSKLNIPIDVLEKKLDDLATKGVLM